MTKNLTIYYFSGTGNAWQIALWFSEYAKEKDIDCQMIDIVHCSGVARNASMENLICFVSPVHGFNYPKIMLDFIRRFPKGKNQVILMNTRGGLRIGRWVSAHCGVSGAAFFVSALILKLKGYKITGMLPFDMPSNWFLINPAYSQKSVQIIFDKNKRRVKLHAEKIFAGKPNFYALRDIVQDTLTAVVSPLYLFAGRFFLSKQFFASSNCNHCGKCEENCPVKAIRNIGGKPYWTARCESCMKCMADCPQNAVETAHGLLLALIVICPPLIAFFSDFLPHIFENKTLHFIYENVVIFTMLYFLYFLQHILLKNRYLSRIITFFSLTHYKWWGKRNPKIKIE
ncbi:MAG: EFR1 family ferrodoxin [Prevotellaceae bacterium]|jgi:ferredoxin/flavodoxin|nr:EFR1 family ferrodoxin [Prevotellaceae bacterium]